MVAKGEACVRLMETLSLTGVAMQMMQTSRPASGSDHQISHLLEMRDIQQHRQGSLHGDKVGIGTLIGMHMYLRLFEGRKMPEQRPTMPADLWREEVRRVYGPLADHALAINPSEPPHGEIWDKQKARLEQAMESYGYDVVDSFKTLLPEARDKIAAMGGPTRPDHLGYSVQDTYRRHSFWQGKPAEVYDAAVGGTVSAGCMTWQTRSPAVCRRERSTEFKDRICWTQGWMLSG